MGEREWEDIIFVKFSLVFFLGTDTSIVLELDSALLGTNGADALCLFMMR